MNLYLAVILFLLLFELAVAFIVDTLNVRHASPVLPEEFIGYFDEEKYRKSQEYLKETTGFGLTVSAVTAAAQIAFILSGGFNYADALARKAGFGPVLTGVIFAAALLLLLQAIRVPFSAYKTFVIEGKFGFNRTSAGTFILDLLKSWMLIALIGAPVFGLIVWFFQAAGQWAWLYCWAAVVVFEFLISFAAPVLIMPLFNKFIPLEDGELKTEIQSYADRQNFRLAGIFKMDGSKRSSKSNAFFTGFGRFKRIALFDTLIEKHTVPELVSVLAHEVGHYKKRHILKSIGISALSTGLMFFLLSFFMNNRGLFEAFRMENLSVYASIIFFSFLYSPVNMLISIIGNIFSRKWEFEADNYAAATYGRPEPMITALKKLSADNLSNLTPHPLKVFVEYSHPPVLERIKAIRGW
jgi:STE24 endopeptidase